MFITSIMTYIKQTPTSKLYLGAFTVFTTLTTAVQISKSSFLFNTPPRYGGRSHCKLAALDNNNNDNDSDSIELISAIYPL